MNRTIAVLVTLVAVGCSRSDSADSERSPARAPMDVPADKPMAAQAPEDRPAKAADDKPAAAMPANAPENKPAAVAADNTEKNQRDQEAAKLTPTDQSENEADRSISQHARENVVKADDLSVDGKNVKIITIDGVVTLRGPVESAREKKDIANLVKQVDGVKRVDNQLEIASK